MELFNFILPFVLAFIAGVLAYLAVSYRKRYYVLKERSDNSITFQERKLEQLGIELAQARNKLRKAEAELLFLKNGDHEPGIAEARRSVSSGMYPDTSSVKRHSPIERHEAKTASQVTEEERRRSETTNTDTWDPMLTQQLFASHTANGNYTTRTATLEIETKSTYPTYVNTGCSDRTETNYSSSDTGSSSSDTCSSSNND